MHGRASRIGLTGGIASGKSEVSRRFEALGITVADADIAAREVVATGSLALLSDAAHMATEGSPPFSRTLTRRPIEAMRSVHVEAKEVQCRVQAWRG